MVKFTVFLNNKVVGTYKLDEPVITIGRLPESMISLYGEGVSRCHVKITEDVDRSLVLYDLHSLNGTYVNGKRVREVALVSGDKIVVCDYTILFEEIDEQGESKDSGENFPNQDDLEESFEVSDYSNSKATMISMPTISDGENNIAKEAAEPAAIECSLDSEPIPAESKAEETDLLVELSESVEVAVEKEKDGTVNAGVLIDGAKHIMYKLDRPTMTIGSDDEDDIYASGLMVSKASVIVEIREEGVYVSANQLMTKMKINGKTVRSHLLNNKDRIELGSNTFRYMEKE